MLRLPMNHGVRQSTPRCPKLVAGNSAYQMAAKILGNKFARATVLAGASHVLVQFDPSQLAHAHDSSEVYPTLRGRRCDECTRNIIASLV